ncbi:MAG: PIN domain-containing protein [Burkholderiaceae bacterium]
MGSDSGSVDTVILDTNIILDLYVYQDPRTSALRSMMAQCKPDLPTCAQGRTELIDVLAREKFRLTLEQQQAIVAQWDQASRCVPQDTIPEAPWRCKDKADQIFLNMAWMHRPCTLLSKDLQVLRFKKRALKEGVVIADQWHSDGETL